MNSDVIILDGPVGTELIARGVPSDDTCWTARAAQTHSSELSAIHREFAAAGATVHTANTFRTQPHILAGEWQKLLRLSIEIAKESVPCSHRIAGSLAPSADCYDPNAVHSDAESIHKQMAESLCEHGCDIILCETFSNVSEAETAVRAAVGTGVETWCSLTAGPEGELLSPIEFADGINRLVNHGISAVLLNCTAVSIVSDYLKRIDFEKIKIPFGVYANAGPESDRLGWFQNADPEELKLALSRYTGLVQQWINSGVTIVGGCCGTSKCHTLAVAQLGLGN